MRKKKSQSKRNKYFHLLCTVHWKLMNGVWNMNNLTMWIRYRSNPTVFSEGKHNFSQKFRSKSSSLKYAYMLSFGSEVPAAIDRISCITEKFHFNLPDIVNMMRLKTESAGWWILWFDIYSIYFFSSHDWMSLFSLSCPQTKHMRAVCCTIPTM